MYWSKYVNGTTTDTRRVRKDLEKGDRSRIQDVVYRLTDRNDEISQQRSSKRRNSFCAPLHRTDEALPLHKPARS